jgi:hypothetical protein
MITCTVGWAVCVIQKKKRPHKRVQRRPNTRINARFIKFGNWSSRNVCASSINVFLNNAMAVQIN